MNKADQLAAAKDLFMSGWSQNRISQAIGITENTISKWVVSNGWRDERARKYNLEESNASRIMEIIDYQIEALSKIAEKRRNVLDDVTGDPNKDHWKLLESGSIDALSKLFATIKGRDMAWTQYVDTMREFLEFLSLRDNELAKSLTSHSDAFLIAKRDVIIN